MEVQLADLWLPILLSGVAVFVVSSILHMCLPIHKGDYRKLPGEDAVMAAMREQGVGPGEYMFPLAGCMSDMKDPEMVSKYEQGPVGFMAVFPNGPPAMGKSLVMWFFYAILIGFCVGYIGTQALAKGAEFMTVFRFTGTIAIVVFGITAIPNSIWRGAGWVSTAKYVFDGVVYGLAAALVFALMWPGA
jgi:amino acid transporter